MLGHGVRWKADRSRAPILAVALQAYCDWIYLGRPLHSLSTLISKKYNLRLLLKKKCPSHLYYKPP